MTLALTALECHGPRLYDGSGLGLARIDAADTAAQMVAMERLGAPEQVLEAAEQHELEALAAASHLFDLKPQT